MIPLITIEGSSQIAAVGHDPATGTLAVRFHTGTVYHYSNVTQEQYDAFINAESLGKFFGQHIKGNEEHPHTKIEGTTKSAHES